MINELKKQPKVAAVNNKKVNNNNKNYKIVPLGILLQIKEAQKTKQNHLKIKKPLEYPNQKNQMSKQKPSYSNNENYKLRIKAIAKGLLYKPIAQKKSHPLSKSPIVSRVVPVAQNKIIPIPTPNKMGSPYKEYFYTEDQNKDYRETMEDFHSIDPTLGMFAIFDGHGGRKPAVYCKDNFAKVLSKSLGATLGNVEKSLSYTFTKIDTELNTKLKEEEETGTTVTLVYITNTEEKRIIYCANVGDSKCYLLTNNGTVSKLTTEHTCADQKEVERIKKLGGYVFNDRVFGSLVVTRSIGDKEMKKYGVIAEPTITKRELNDEDTYVVLGSDGVWDVIGEDNLKVFAKEDMKAETFCKRLVNTALKEGTRDNISCIVIKL